MSMVGVISKSGKIRQALARPPAWSIRAKMAPPWVTPVSGLPTSLSWYGMRTRTLSSPASSTSRPSSVECLTEATKRLQISRRVYPGASGEVTAVNSCVASCGHYARRNVPWKRQTSTACCRGPSMSQPGLLKSGLRALRHAVERRRHPQRFILVDQTPWEEIFRDDIMSVRRYRLPAMDRISVDGEPVPVADGVARTLLLLVPALGIHAWTFDIMPNRSMVRYLMARGFEVYLLDWGRPSASHRELRLDTYVNDWLPAAVLAVREDSGA